MFEQQDEEAIPPQRKSLSDRTISFLKKSVGESPGRWKNIVGLICVFCVVFLWVSSGELIQVYQKNYSNFNLAYLYIKFFKTTFCDLFFNSSIHCLFFRIFFFIKLERINFEAFIT